MKNPNTGVGGICTLVFIVFLTLKLAGVGSVAVWSWWWVTSPIWLPIAAIIGFLVVMGILAVIGFVISLIFTKKSKKNEKLV